MIVTVENDSMKATAFYLDFYNTQVDLLLSSQIVFTKPQVFPVLLSRQIFPHLQ